MECRVHKLVADVAPLSGGRVLLVRYRDTSRYDGQRGWFLPDDFLEWEEHPADGAKRILRDQAAIESASLRLAEVESFGNGAWHLVFHYAADIPEGQEITPGANIAEAAWFDLNALPAAADMAHEGWGLEVLERVLAGRA